MARSYTEEELASSLSKVVRTSLDRLYGALGNRRTDISFSQIQDAAAGVFISQTNAPYYIVQLATLTADELASAVLNVLLDLDDTIRSTDRRVFPISNLSDLANARSALSALSSASSARQTSITDVKSVPAYRRFEQSTSRFLSDYGKNIKSGTDIVQTPQEARVRLADLLASFEQGYMELMRRTSQINAAIADFDALNLPATFSSAIITNSRDVLADRFDQLEALDEKARLALLRDVTLDVLTTRAAVAGFSSLSPTVLFLYYKGQASVFADAQHPATPAAVVADEAGAYILLDASLDLLVDGTTSISVGLPDSYVASSDGVTQERYDITADNDGFIVNTSVDGDVAVALTQGTSRSAQQICDDINVSLAPTVAVAEPYAPNPYLLGEPVTLGPTTGVIGPYINLRRLSGDWSTVTSLEPFVDRAYIVDTGTPVNTGWYILSSFPPYFSPSAPGYPTEITLQKETGTPVPSTTAVVTMSKGGRAVRITIKEPLRVAALSGSWTIGLPVSTTPFTPAQKQIFTLSLGTLGMVADGTFTSSKTSVQQCVDAINNNPAIAPLGVPRIKALSVFSAEYATGAGRTVPEDPFTVVVSKYTAQVDLLYASGNDGQVMLADVGDVQVGDAVAIRSATTNVVGNWGEVTAVGANSFMATFQTAPITEAGITVEVGEDFTTHPLPMVVSIQNDPTGFNTGDYEVGSVGGFNGGGIPFELTLNKALPIPYTLGFQAISLGETGVGQYRLKVQSTSTLAATRLKVQATSNLGGSIWPALPVESVGTTQWFKLPAEARGTESGDTLEFRDSSAEAVSFSRTISRIEGSLLFLGESLPLDLQQYTSSQNSPAPSVRVRKLRKDTYDKLKQQTGMWLGLPLSDVARVMGSLRKLVNPIIVNENPTLVSVQNATAKTQELVAHVAELQGYLQSYTAPLVEPVDRLIETYQQQGADRALAALLEARFSDFFGMDQDDSSYNGYLRKNMRDVSREDFPITKNARNPGGYVFGSYEEPDYEYDLSDSVGVELPDPTQEVYEFP